MYNFKEIEHKANKILNKDSKKRVVDDYKRKKLFSFLEGPPTANAPPALHHLEVRTYKDIINKFKYMQGFNVPRKAGWDCHGLPVEVQIEKKLKLNSKKDILTFGESKFINECKNSVFEYIEKWNKSTERLNYEVDLSNPYVTLDNNYIESVWWSLKELYNKKMLYESHKVVPFCPRCQTPLSSHEVAQGYKNVKEDSIIVKFKVMGKNEYLLVFTTTPWTLPSNVGIAVNTNIDYNYVSGENGETFIIAKELTKTHFPEAKIIKTVKGSKLIGIHYEPLFPYFKDLEAFRLIEGDFVTETDGTGLVHMAPAFGEVDYEACKKEKLPFVQPVDENGKFTHEVTDYKEMSIRDSNIPIIIKLKTESKLFKKIKYEHEYPFCWRCDTPLMYYAIKSWFIRVTKYKERLIELNKKINWVPKHIKEGRFGEWLKNVKDWALSRKKFWGTPLPIWRCSCGEEEIIGSIEELKNKSNKKITDKEIDLHKPWIDNITLTCKKCKKEMRRVSDVIDCWYDSGAVSFAQFHYPFENKDKFAKRFPYDFISEAIDQTRGWFYTLHVISTILFNDIAYKNVICAGHIVDEKGEKMSKSKGNILDHDMVLDTLGVDATRLQFCTVEVGNSKKFGIETVKKDIMPFMNTLINISQFYKEINNNKKPENRIEDKWIISRLNSTIGDVTNNLENYQIERALNPLIDFIVNDFSKTYIKIIRDREDKGVKEVMSELIEKIAQMLAPYAPHISEVIYSGFSDKSVLSSSWPELNKSKINLDLENKFNSALKIIERGLAERDKAKIGLRWPLSSALIKTEIKLDEDMRELIVKQLNLKRLDFEIGDEEIVTLDINITPELEAEGFAREIARKIQSVRKERNMKKEEKITLELYIGDELKASLLRHIDFISKRVGAVKTTISDDKKKKWVFFDIKSEKIGFNF
ncbi:MAG: isoleucine--tRNA ligase [Nanoarchaeota archaeon]